VRKRAGGMRRWSPRIEIRDLQVLGVHGVLPEERQRAQPFSLDIDVWVDRADAIGDDAIGDDSIGDDSIGDTVDYGELVERAAEMVSSSSFQLVETLAGAVASSLLDVDRRVVAVAVTVRKLRPPLPHHVGSVGVRVVRRRDVDTPAEPGADDLAEP